MSPTADDVEGGPSDEGLEGLSTVFVGTNADGKMESHAIDLLTGKAVERMSAPLNTTRPVSDQLAYVTEIYSKLGKTIPTYVMDGL